MMEKKMIISVPCHFLRPLLSSMARCVYMKQNIMTFTQDQKRLAKCTRFEFMDGYLLI